MKLTENQQRFAKEELRSIVLCDLEANWKDYILLVSEKLAEEFELEECETTEALFKTMDAYTKEDEEFLPSLPLKYTFR